MLAKIHKNLNRCTSLMKSGHLPKEGRRKYKKKKKISNYSGETGLSQFQDSAK